MAEVITEGGRPFASPITTVIVASTMSPAEIVSEGNGEAFVDPAKSGQDGPRV